MRRRLWIVLRACALMAAVVFLARGVCWQSVMIGSRRAGFALPVLVVLLNGGMMLVKALRLRILLPQQSLRLRTAFAVLLTASALNSVVPLRGGDVARLWLLERAGGVSKSVAIAIAAVEAVLDITVLAALGLGAALALPGQRWATPVAWVVAGGVGILLILSRSKRGATAPAGARSDGVPGIWAGIRQAVRRVQLGFRVLGLPRVATWAGLLTLLGWTCETAMVMVCGRALGVPVGPALAIMVLLGINLAMALPVTPSGLGLFEGAASAVLVLAGVAKAQAVTFAFLYHALQVIPVTLVGLTLFLVLRRRPGERRPQAQESLRSGVWPLALPHRQRLRVLIVVPYDLCEPGGGVKHHAVGLARILRARGDHVMLAGPSSRPVGEPDSAGFSGVINVRGNGSSNRLGLLVNPWAVRRFLLAHRFDIIHVHDPLAPGLPYWITWLSGRAPKICTFHAFAEEPSLGLRLGHRVSAWLTLRSFQRGIAVSAAAARLVQGVWGRPLSVVPNGVHTDVFTPALGYEHAHAVDRDHPLRLFFCARISDERKGFADLLRAYTILRDNRVPVTLDVAGEAAGPLPPALPGLTYHGPVSLPALVGLFQGCDVLVAPSTGQESFGIILLEAMATGRPIVCSDIEGYRQVVDRKGAYLSPSRSPEQLAHAIAMLAADPQRRRRMSLVNRRRALEFDWGRLAEHVRAQYLLALADRPEEAVRAPTTLDQASDEAGASPGATRSFSVSG